MNGMNETKEKFLKKQEILVRIQKFVLYLYYINQYIKYGRNSLH